MRSLALAAAACAALCQPAGADRLQLDSGLAVCKEMYGPAAMLSPAYKAALESGLDGANAYFVRQRRDVMRRHNLPASDEAAVWALCQFYTGGVQDTISYLSATNAEAR